MLQRRRLIAEVAIKKLPTSVANKRLITRTPIKKDDPVRIKEASKKRARKAIEENLKLISLAEVAIDEATAQIDRAYKAVDAEMRLAELASYTHEGYLAEITENWTRALRVIDPKKYRNKVTDEVFWASVEVGVTKAKEYLTDTEIDKLLSKDSKNAEPKGKTLKINKMSGKKRRVGP